MFKYLILLSGIVALAGCSRSPSPTDAKPGDAGVVKTGKPVKRTLKRVIEQPASVEAFEEAPLVAHISGYVGKVHADIGQRVSGPQYDANGEQKKPGDLLAVLLVPEMLEEHKQKQALVKLADAEVEQAKASLEAAEAHILTAKALVTEAESARDRAAANHNRWQSELKRVEDLVASKVVDRQIRDETLNQVESAKAAKKEVEAKVQSAEAMKKESEAKRNKAKADLDAAKARVDVAQAEEGRLKALVEYRHVRAPFDSVVTRRNIHTGHFLQPGGILFQVARLDKLRIVADIPETDAMYIDTKSTARIQSPTLKEIAFDAKVARTSWTLDTKSRNLRIEFDQPAKGTPLRPGMFVNVSFTVEFKDRVTLPSSAIFTHADQPHCYRVVDGKAVRTPLKLGIREGGHVEVRDFDPEQEVVLTNLAAVSDGKELPRR